jgi:hypothetical protein
MVQHLFLCDSAASLTRARPTWLCPEDTFSKVTTAGKAAEKHSQWPHSTETDLCADLCHYRVYPQGSEKKQGL